MNMSAPAVLSVSDSRITRYFATSDTRNFAIVVRTTDMLDSPQLGRSFGPAPYKTLVFSYGTFSGNDAMFHTGTAATGDGFRSTVQMIVLDAQTGEIVGQALLAAGCVAG